MMTLMVTTIKQVKAARMPTLMVEPVSIRLYDDSRVLFHENVAMHYFHDDQWPSNVVAQVVWSKKMNFDVACLMKFHDFPFEYSSLHSLSWKSFVLSPKSFITWVENILITSFAFSTQHCEIKFHSYGYTVKDYTLMWDRNIDGKVCSAELI